MKYKIFKITSKSLVALLAMYGIYIGFVWDRGWKHYKKGGGVFIHDSLNVSEMELSLIQFRRYSVLNPLSTGSRNYSGKCLIYLGRYKEAIQEFDSSLSIRNNFTANYRKAYAYKMLKNYVKMSECLKAASKQENNFNSVVRFKTEFSDVKNHPSMGKFIEQL